MTLLRHRRNDRCEPVLWPGNEPIRLFTEGDDLYAAMRTAISHARSEVELESYIFANDEAGWQLAEVLAERARAGIHIRMHLDAAGSLFWASRRITRFLRENGVNLRWFHRWYWRHPLRYNQRNHRKLLVVDRQEAFLGGFNIHRENSLALYGDVRWRDTHVAITGGLARQAHQAFEALWQGCPWSPDPDGQPESAVVLPNKSPGCQHRLSGIFAAMFASARQRIDLTTPYFVPDRQTQKALADAAARGVQVRLLVPYKGDTAPVRWAAGRIYNRLLGTRIRIFGYRPRLLHAKTVTVDSDWATVGTANLDYRSFFLNHELNLCARSPALAEALDAQFEADLAESEEFLPTGRLGLGPWDWTVAPLAWGARKWL